MVASSRLAHDREAFLSPCSQISSGPTVVQRASGITETSREILKKYQISDEKVFNVLARESGSGIRPVDVVNFIIGSNTIAIEAAERVAQVSPNFIGLIQARLNNFL